MLEIKWQAGSALLLTLCITGCLGPVIQEVELPPLSPTSSTPSAPIISEPPSQVATVSQHPSWILNPPPAKNKKAWLVASASVQPFGGIDAQRRAALLRARSDISKIRRAYLESVDETALLVSGTGSAPVQQHTSFTRETAHDWAKSSLEIEKEWVHPETKELFLLIVY